jgi:hypothetical protein
LEHLLEVGLNFLAMARNPTCRATDEHVFQNVHWGMELVLKAYLHRRGWTDARCRAELGHDIALALAACERAGLTSIDADARALISALSPFSKKHQVAAFVTLGAAGYTSCQANEAANAIAQAVCLTTDRADRRGKPSLTAEPYVSAGPFCGRHPATPLE